ncbi:hypothetical protein GCM10028807_62620 [Spirosoma daeguense]
MKFAYIIDADLNIIDIAGKGSDRLQIWNEILGRSQADLDNLKPLTIVKIFQHHLLEKLQLTLQQKIKENASLPSDHSQWEGRFREEDVFVKKLILGQTYKLYTSGRENTIIFLANIYDFILQNPTSDLFEVTGSNHSEIKRVLSSTPANFV